MVDILQKHLEPIHLQLIWANCASVAIRSAYDALTTTLI